MLECFYKIVYLLNAAKILASRLILFLRLEALLHRRSKPCTLVGSDAMSVRAGPYYCTFLFLTTTYMSKLSFIFLTTKNRNIVVASGIVGSAIGWHVFLGVPCNEQWLKAWRRTSPCCNIVITHGTGCTVTNCRTLIARQLWIRLLSPTRKIVFGNGRCTGTC